jgi:uncharacterized membrane protein YphA (DoxX/SURF4 family)
VSIRSWLFKADASPSTVLVRLLVGGVFFSEGIQKFLFRAALGVSRFTTIGIPAPAVMAPFVGYVEIICGALVMIGLLTRLAAVPLIIDISVAIATTKIPMWLSKVEQGLLADGSRSPHGLLHAPWRNLFADRGRRLLVMGSSAVEAN